MPTFRDQHGVPMISSAGPSFALSKNTAGDVPDTIFSFPPGRRRAKTDEETAVALVDEDVVDAEGSGRHSSQQQQQQSMNAWPRATDAEQQDGRRSRTKEQQELANQSEESPRGHAHLHVRVSQNEVPDVFRQTANSINGRQRHHRAGQLTLPPLLLL